MGTRHGLSEAERKSRNRLNDDLVIIGRGDKNWPMLIRDGASVISGLLT
jgi:hypothetical protein